MKQEFAIWNDYMHLGILIIGNTITQGVSIFLHIEVTKRPQ